jgi:hypothetical protein
VNSIFTQNKAVKRDAKASELATAHQATGTGLMPRRFSRADTFRAPYLPASGILCHARLSAGMRLIEGEALLIPGIRATEFLPRACILT